MSLFTAEHHLPHSDARKSLETSETEPPPTDLSSEAASSAAEELIHISRDIDLEGKCGKQKTQVLYGEGIVGEENNNLQNVKSYEECNECNGKVVNDALSHENVQLIKGIKSKEKKLRDTRRQLNEERAFYEQQKMDLWKTITKKKSKNQLVQTEASNNSPLKEVEELENQIASLRRELEKEAEKSGRLEEKCRSLRRKNGKLKSEVSLNREDCGQSWKGIQEKLEDYKKDGNSERSAGIIKNVYDQVLKKNASLAKSNFTLQAELRRLYRKFEQFDKSPSVTKLPSRSSVVATSSPDLRKESNPSHSAKKRRMKRSKTAPCRTSVPETSDNLIVSGSLISVHVQGEEKRLRPVFLVLDDKKKRQGTKLFGSLQGGRKCQGDLLRAADVEASLEDKPKSESLGALKSGQEAYESDTATIQQQNSFVSDDEEVLKKEKNKGKEPAQMKTKDIELDLGMVKKGDQKSYEHNNAMPKENVTSKEIKHLSETDETLTNQELHDTLKQFKENYLEIQSKISESLAAYQETEEERAGRVKQVADSMASDTDSCVIECKTHSSSVQ